MDKHCRSCGAELTEPVGNHCPNCGTELAASKKQETPDEAKDEQSSSSEHVETPVSGPGPEKPRPEKTFASSKTPADPIIPASNEKRRTNKRTPLLITGAIAAVVIVVIAILVVSGSSSSSTPTTSINVLPTPEELPSSTVAVVSHVPSSARTISTADLAHSISQQATQNKLKSVPTPGQPKYQETEEAALGEILDGIWIGGQANEMGITVSQTELEAERDRIKKQNFPSEKEYQEFLKSSHFTEADVLARVKLQVLSTKIQEQISNGIKGGASAQQKGFSKFVTAYQKRWRSRTVCAAEYVIERCSNGPQPKSESSAAPSTTPTP